MADEEPRETLRVALRAFDTPHLQRLRTAAYDRWTWDTGSQADRDWFEVADEILTEERGVVFDMSGNETFDSGIIIGAGNMPTHVKITAEKMMMENPNCRGMDHELFEFNSGNIDLGFALRQALLKFLVDELNFGSTFVGNSGTMKTAVEAVAMGNLHMQEWQIKEMFERFMKEREEKDEVPG